MLIFIIPHLRIKFDPKPLRPREVDDPTIKIDGGTAPAF
jgi:hypothetical protein